MVTEKLLVVVIVTPNSARHVPLLKMLKGDERFEIKTLSATMLNTNLDLQTSGIKYDQCYSQIFEGRDLTSREIGCANSHNLARAMISENPLGGVILEDDARITNSELFYRISMAFLVKQSGKPFVLNLTGLRFVQLRNPSFFSSLSNLNMTLYGKPDLAAAYALSQVSSRILLNANLPIRSVADWPESDCIYQVALNPVVAHGDENTKSTIAIIGSDFRKGITFKQKMKLLTFYSFKNSQGITFRTYIRKVLINRITWHADFLRYRVKLIFLRIKYR